MLGRCSHTRIFLRLPKVVHRTCDRPRFLRQTFWKNRFELEASNRMSLRSIRARADAPFGLALAAAFLVLAAVEILSEVRGRWGSHSPGWVRACRLQCETSETVQCCRSGTQTTNALRAHVVCYRCVRRESPKLDLGK